MMSELRDEIQKIGKAVFEGKQTAMIRQTVRDLYDQVFGEGAYKRIEIPEWIENDGVPEVTMYETLPREVVYRFKYALNRLRRWSESESVDAEEIIAAVQRKLANPGV